MRPCAQTWGKGPLSLSDLLTTLSSVLGNQMIGCDNPDCPYQWVSGRNLVFGSAWLGPLGLFSIFFFFPCRCSLRALVLCGAWTLTETLTVCLGNAIYTVPYYMRWCKDAIA